VIFERSGEPACADPSAKDDDGARDYWYSRGEEVRRDYIRAARRLDRSLPQRTRFLVHVPSGLPVFPLGAAYSEGTTFQVAILAKRGAPRRIEVSLNQCSDANTFRTTLEGDLAPAANNSAPEALDAEHRVLEKAANNLGNIVKKKDIAAMKVMRDELEGHELDEVLPLMEKLISEGESKNQNADKTAKLQKDIETKLKDHLEIFESEYQLVPIGQYFTCGAGSITYDVRTMPVGLAGAERPAEKLSTVKMRIRERYHVTAIAAIGSIGRIERITANIRRRSRAIRTRLRRARSGPRSWWTKDRTPPVSPRTSARNG
jgi:hypothetical protein